MRRKVQSGFSFFLALAVAIDGYGGDTSYIPFIVIFLFVIFLLLFFYVVLLNEGAVNYGREEGCSSTGTLFSFLLFLFYFCIAFTLSLGSALGGLSDIWDSRGLFIFSWYKVLYKNVMHGSDWQRQKGKSVFLANGRKLSTRRAIIKKHHELAKQSKKEKKNKTQQDRYLGHKTPQTRRQTGRQVDRLADRQA